MAQLANGPAHTETLAPPRPGSPGPASTRSASGVDASRSDGRGGLHDSPVDRQGLLLVLATYVVLSALTIGVGWLIVEQLGAVRHLDDDVARWLADRRTDSWNAVTWAGSGIADVFVKVPAAVVLSAVFLWRWRRWNEVALLVGGLVLEASVFATASLVVGRARPPVSQLDSIPLTSSYPSGHTGAAVVFYGAVAVITFWHTRRTVARGIAVTAAVVLPFVVGASRMYRGMHHLSDVVVGVIVGATSLWVVWLVVDHPTTSRRVDPDPSVTTPAHR